MLAGYPLAERLALAETLAELVAQRKRVEAERDDALDSRDEWQRTANLAADEAQRLRRENEDYRVVHERLVEQLAEARSQIPEDVKVGGDKL